VGGCGGSWREAAGQIEEGLEVIECDRIRNRTASIARSGGSADERMGKEELS